MPEFLVRLVLTDELPDVVELVRLRAAERERAARLADDGVLVRLWRPEGEEGNVGLWNAPSESRLYEALRSLPLWPFMRCQVTALQPHPFDPVVLR